MSSNKNQADTIEGEVIKGNPTDDFKQRATKFQTEYAALCEKYQCQIVVAPFLKPTNHETFEFAQSVTIGQLPKQN